ncbi:hypothetical protein NE237_024141 [Protea cynaroides]|uniref:RING-type domain-containing protein n=1 Tax=Protea cynaroides TaxID=273540 RepID=A0A9Q0K624_9MAGN|nr:hypothetical protein NE237_024141 [Protea cynaroides]
MSSTTVFHVCFDVEPQTDEGISIISMTDQSSMPFTFQYNDVHLKIRRSTSDVQIVDSRLFAAKEELFPFDSLSSVEILKSCMLNVLLNDQERNMMCRDLIEDLIKHIAISACNAFRANQVRGVRTVGFNVNIEFQMIEECEEDEDTVMREITEATMEIGPAMVPASNDSIERMLKTRKSEKEEIGETCTVCLEEFSIGLEIKDMPCGHAFHGHCIVKWLQQSHYCPLCRFPMPVHAD